MRRFPIPTLPSENRWLVLQSVVKDPVEGICAMSVTNDTSVLYFRLAPQKCGVRERFGCVYSQSPLSFRSRRSSPAGLRCLLKAVLYYEALLWTAIVLCAVGTGLLDN